MKTMMKPVIGITPLWDDKMNNIWMLQNYIDALRAAGGSPVVLTLTDDEDEISSICSKCDGILFAGGEDIDPKYYGETPIAELGPVCAARDTFEFKLFGIARKMNKPVLGICKGMQLINAAMGGTLYQDLYSQHPSDTDHRMKPPYYAASHYVNVVKNSLMDKLFVSKSDVCESDIFKTEFCKTENATPDSLSDVSLNTKYLNGRLGVNSRHHEAVKDLAKGLETLAVSEDGLIEAYCSSEGSFILGVQWHPEYMYGISEENSKIFRLFIMEASKNL